MNSSANPPETPPEFRLQSHEIARGFALVEPQPARTIEAGNRTIDYAMARHNRGRGTFYGIWLCERGQESRGHWVVAQTEPPFAPFQIENRSVRYRPIPKPMILSALNNRDGLTLARFVASPLPNSAPYALLIPGGHGCWFAYGRVASFDFAADAPIELSSASAATWLHRELQNPASSVQFANNWISLNAAGKTALVYGADWIEEIEIVMRHVLQLLPNNGENRWQEWTLYASPPHGRGWETEDESAARLLESWANWLARHCLARRLAQGLNYRCISDQSDDEIAQVSRPDTPSAHQKLESLLWLRDWLRTAATPDECAHLLAL